MVTRKTASKTTSKKTSTTSSSKAGTAKPAPKPAATAANPASVAPTVETAQAAAVADAPSVGKLRKRELFNRVKARSVGVKGSDVRLVMDAVLDELGTLLVQGDTIDARPLGVLKVQKRKPVSGGDVVVCKLRRKKPSDGGKDPLAEAAE